VISSASAFHCVSCQRYFAEEELKKIPAGSGFLHACPTCGRAVAEERSRVARSMPPLLAGAFLYPVRGATLFVVLGTLLALTVTSYVPFVGGILSTSLLVGFLFAVLRSTAAGSEELEVSAEDIGDRAAWLRPLFKYLLALAISFGPGAVAWTLLGGGEAGPLPWILAGVGALYLPAALVVAAHARTTLGALNVAAGVGFIARLPAAYLLTSAFSLVAMALGALLYRGAIGVTVPVLGGLLRGVAMIYGPMVAMRMLGLLVEEHAEEL